MQKLKLFLMGFGFFWIFAWSIFGSILGAYLERIVLTQANEGWMSGWQNSLLRTAHAHMNLMGVTSVLLAVTLPSLRGFLSDKNIAKIVCANVVSVPIFGLGLVLEAFFPSANTNGYWAIAITAIGGIIYMLSIGLWGSLCIACAIRKNE